jgi:hypothetical protein
MGSCIEIRGLRSEEVYIQTPNNTQKGASTYNMKLFIETRVKTKRAIYLNRMLSGKEHVKILGKILDKVV